MNRSLFTLIAVIAMSSGSLAFGLENTLNISEAHFTNLGVTLGKFAPVKDIPKFYAPAKVVIPPSQEYIVSTSQAGLINKLTVAVGDQVKKGQILATLNSPDLLNLQLQYLNADNSLNLAVNSYERDKKLFAEGVIAERRVKETASQFNAAQFHASEAKQLLEIAGESNTTIEQLAKTKKLNGQFSVTAPISGVVLERMAVAGTRVDNLAPLYRLGVLDELWLEINIPQERLSDIKVGDQVVIENTSVKAEIAVLGQSVNPENQTVLARAIIKGLQTTVRPGQKVSTQIVQKLDNNVYKLPNTALAQNEGSTFIFIRTPSGFSVTPVKVLGKEGEESIISGSFNGDEHIATQGAVALKATWLGLGSAK